ncbi:MAG: histidinol-phosphatase [Balneolaceae bacterium]
MKKEELIRLRNAAETIAREAGQSTLRYFKNSFDLEFKSDETPVTNADREAEELVRESVRLQFPEHGLIGEEFGSEGEERDVVWIVDPIDGTQSFIHGVPFYTTLIGILIDGEPQVGVIYAPALDEMVTAAKGSGTFLNGKPSKVRRCRDLGSATFLTTDLEHIRQYKFDSAFEELLRQSRIHRTWGDAYGHLMVATGRADIMFDPILSIWDAAALLPVVTEAGGSFTDVHGVESIRTGNAISCTKELKSNVLSLFRKK